MSTVAGYLLLSLPLAIVCIVRPRATGPRMLLVILDTVRKLIPYPLLGRLTSYDLMGRVDFRSC